MGGGDLSSHVLMSEFLTLVHPQINLSSLLTVKTRRQYWQHAFNALFAHLIYR